MAFNFFKKKTKDKVESDISDTTPVEKNWYSDRYQSAIVQRNILALICVVSVFGVCVSVIGVIKVATSKTVDPFVIEIEEKTGITNVIRPINIEEYSNDEALKRYFVAKYVNARESYDQNSYDYFYYTIVKMLSDQAEYARFYRLINSNEPFNPLKLGKKSRSIKIKSISFFDDVVSRRGASAEGANKNVLKAQVRFLVQGGFLAEVKHKIATILFEFKDLRLTAEQRYINPLGFQVISYRVDDEAL